MITITIYELIPNFSPYEEDFSDRKRNNLSTNKDVEISKVSYSLTPKFTTSLDVDFDLFTNILSKNYNPIHQLFNQCVLSIKDNEHTTNFFNRQFGCCSEAQQAIQESYKIIKNTY